MGLIRAALGAAGGTLADSWKEYFYCDAMDADVLVARGKKQTSRRSSNRHGNDNIITDGSGIAVADGQCMIIVEDGKVVDVCAEPGRYTYDASQEPSLFTGDLKADIRNTFDTIGRRFAYGGDTGRDQRVYYFNTREITDNKYGTAAPIPFRIVDARIGLDIDVSVRCNGVYSYRIANPLLFYANVCGNVEEEYTREELDGQLKTEFISALQPAFARLSGLQIRPNELPAHVQELTDAMNDALTKKWSGLRGIEVVSVAMNSVTLPEEDAEMIKQAQRTAVWKDPAMAAASLTQAQADAMKSAAANPAGAVSGFWGMNMAQGAQGADAGELYRMAAQNQKAASAETQKPEWTCSCGAVNTGKFCTECGKPKPMQESWTCSCGTVNTGKFCTECGRPRPAAGSWTCSCGTVNTGKFCTECGKPRP